MGGMEVELPDRISVQEVQVIEQLLRLLPVGYHNKNLSCKGSGKRRKNKTQERSCNPSQADLTARSELLN